MKNNKKGFTIVELVIVIAVIAILAAVLIPTFSGIVTKAKENAALQEAKNEYTNIYALALSSDGVIDVDDDFDADGNKVDWDKNNNDTKDADEDDSKVEIKTTKDGTSYIIETAEYKFTFDAKGILTKAEGVSGKDTANFNYDVKDGVIKSAKTKTN